MNTRTNAISNICKSSFEYINCLRKKTWPYFIKCMYSSHNDWNQNFRESDMLFSFILVFPNWKFSRKEGSSRTLTWRPLPGKGWEWAPSLWLLGVWIWVGSTWFPCPLHSPSFPTSPWVPQVFAYFFSLIASLESKTSLFLVLLSWLLTWAES